jgi:hypothetical protein
VFSCEQTRFSMNKLSQSVYILCCSAEGFSPYYKIVQRNYTLSQLFRRCVLRTLICISCRWVTILKSSTDMQFAPPIVNGQNLLSHGISPPLHNSLADGWSKVKSIFYGNTSIRVPSCMPRTPHCK